ncbi:MarR family winged helix-turn-helix transcriptional regulator [Sporofaciens musculi]|uniref:MarR family winged helix-turn-helix transcriptional regulator n=1 Tax=Sporofaciens musculi TaxID=2681861 RepID=UPI00259C6C57|nr:MarR family winged helix-turn-helix transcriptional regulator [Sporofaciens musculi]
MMPELHPGMKEFNRIFKECNHIYHDIALKLGLSDSGFDILYTLCEIGDGCLQKDICDATMLSKQTIHSSVQKLAKDGYLSLQPGKGRDLHIHLTSAGKALMEEKITPAIQTENLAFTDMSKDEQEEFLRLNRKYADSLRRHAAQL